MILKDHELIICFSFHHFLKINFTIFIRTNIQFLSKWNKISGRLKKIASIHLSHKSPRGLSPNPARSGGAGTRSTNSKLSSRRVHETFAILRGYLGFCLFQRPVRDGPCNFRNLDPSLRVFWSPFHERGGEIAHLYAIVTKLSPHSIETRESSSSRFDQKCDSIPGTRCRKQFQFWKLHSFERVTCSSSRASPSSPVQFGKLTISASFTLSRKKLSSLSNEKTFRGGGVSHLEIISTRMEEG